MIGLYNASPPSASHHYITKDLFIEIPFTNTSYPNHSKRQRTQFEEIEQAPEPDMARMLELSD